MSAVDPATAPDAKPSGKLRSATVWSYGQTLGKMAITTGLSLVLAAMLGPRAFGVIAMALVFTNFIEMLQQQGLMPAIISRKRLTDVHADTAFWLVTGVGLICTALGIALAPWWSGVNQLPELTPVIWALALGIPVTSSVVVHEAMLRRDLEFKKLAIRTWVSVLAGGVAGITAALVGLGVWALVLQQLVMAVTAALVLWGVTSWRPRRRFSMTAARELWSYSLRSSGASLGVFVGGRIDVVLAGAFFGPVVVGLYRMGQRLTALVLDVTGRSMQAVSLPGLAELQDRKDLFAERLLGMQRFTTCLALPALGVVFGAAGNIERVLGSQWVGTAQVIHLLVAAQAVTSLTLLLGPALQAAGRPGTQAIVTWVWTGTTVGGLLLASQASDRNAIVALCLAVIFGAVVASSTMLIVSSRLLEVPVRRMLWAFAPGLLAGAGAAAATWAASSVITLGPELVQFVLASLVGVTVAGMIVVAVEPQARRGVATVAAMLRPAARRRQHDAPAPTTSTTSRTGSASSGSVTGRQPETVQALGEPPEAGSTSDHAPAPDRAGSAAQRRSPSRRVGHASTTNQPT